MLVSVLEQTTEKSNQRQAKGQQLVCVAITYWVSYLRRPNRPIKRQENRLAALLLLRHDSPEVWLQVKDAETLRMSNKNK